MQDFILSFVPVSLRQNADVFRRARLVVATSFVTVIVASIYSLQYLLILQSGVSAACLAFCAACTFAVPFILRSTGSISITGNMVVALFMFANIVLVYVEGGPDSATRQWMVAIPLLATLFNGIGSGLRWTFGTFAVLITFHILKPLGYIFPMLPVSPAQQYTQSILSILGIVMLVSVLSRLFEQGKNRTLVMLEDVRKTSEDRATADFRNLEDLKAANETRAAEDLRQIAAQRTYLAGSVEDILQAVERVAQGDLTVQVAVGQNDDIARLSQGLTRGVENIRQMLFRVAESVNETTHAVSAISSATEQLAVGASEQSRQVMQVAGAVEEMSRTIAENTQQTSVAAFEASEANMDAQRGGEVVHSMIANVKKVGSVVIESAEKVIRLGKSSEQIGEITQAIEEIADQTNLLALNAAIEAARAGEAGRGFAVVADEVRKLAERTQKATKEISTMISTIQREMSEAVHSMNAGKELVSEGTKLAEQTSAAFEHIVNRTSKVSDVISQVAAASEEQSATSDNMAQNMTVMSETTEESSKGLGDIARSIEGLLRQAEDLQALVGQFSIGMERPQQRLAARTAGLLRASR